MVILQSLNKKPNMTKPLISVLIPTYNVEEYITEAINSILNQTYERLEVVIVDDGSTDRTYEILESIALKDNRIQLYRNKENQRIVNTLNTAIKYSKGDYIARMDGDDISDPKRLEQQLLFLLKNKDVALVASNVVVIDEQGNTIQYARYLADFASIKEATKYFSPVNHFWLAKREVYEKVGPYRIPTVEDYDFILRAIDHGFIVSNVQEFLYQQRMRKGNTATAAGLIQRKSLKYVRFLARERLLSDSTNDSFSPRELDKALKTTKLEEKLFQLSANLHHKYISHKNKSFLLALLFRVASVVLSPVEQIRHLYERWKYKQLFRTDRKKVAS
jgi:glycosyltransferase involved in cell wall biosynthesis